MTLSYERGKTAVLYATFSQYGVPVDPTELKIAIYYKGNVIVPPTDMTKISDSYYYYSLNITDDFELDAYSAVYTGKINGIDFKQEETFNVVAYGTLSGIPDTSTYYCTNADVRRELLGVYIDDLDNIDTIIGELILEKQEEVDTLCNTTFSTTQETVWLDGNGLTRLQLPHGNIVSVSTCTIRVVISTAWYNFQNIAYINTLRSDGIEIRTASSESEVEAADLLVDCSSGELIIPPRIMYQQAAAYPFWNYTFPLGVRNVQVEYSHGFSSTTRPRAIRNLCAKLVAREILLRKGDQISGGTTGFSADGFSKSYPGIPYAARLERLEADIERLVQRNRVIGVG